MSFYVEFLIKCNSFGVSYLAVVVIILANSMSIHLHASEKAIYLAVRVIILLNSKDSSEQYVRTVADLWNGNSFGVLLDFSLTVKAATLIFISGRGSAISSAKEGKSGFIYNLVKSQ